MTNDPAGDTSIDQAQDGLYNQQTCTNCGMETIDYIVLCTLNCGHLHSNQPTAKPAPEVPREVHDLLNEIEYSADARFNHKHGGFQFRLGVSSVVNRIRIRLAATTEPPTASIADDCECECSHIKRTHQKVPNRTACLAVVGRDMGGKRYCKCPEFQPAKPEEPVCDPSERCRYKFPGGSIECDVRRDIHDGMDHEFQPTGGAVVTAKPSPQPA